LKYQLLQDDYVEMGNQNQAHMSTPGSPSTANSGLLKNKLQSHILRRNHNDLQPLLPASNDENHVNDSHH